MWGQSQEEWDLLDFELGADVDDGLVGSTESPGPTLALQRVWSRTGFARTNPSGSSPASVVATSQSVDCFEPVQTGAVGAADPNVGWFRLRQTSIDWPYRTLEPPDWSASGSSLGQAEPVSTSGGSISVV